MLRHLLGPELHLLRDTRRAPHPVALGAGTILMGIVFFGLARLQPGLEYVGDGLDHTPQLPHIPPDPEHPYTDMNGRRILYPLSPTGVSAYDTTMSSGDDGGTPDGAGGHPPQNSPDALELRKTDPLRYYQTYYANMSRSELAQTDESLYRKLLKLERELGHDIMLRNQPFGTEPLNYYKHLYSGLTRGQLAQENPRYYEYLRYHNLLDSVPFAETAYGGDPLKYYHDHYEGLSRGKLQDANPALYMQLTRILGADGQPLITQVDVQLPGEHDPYQYYKDHYDGMTKDELRLRDPKTYWQLRRWGLINLLPK